MKNNLNLTIIFIVVGLMATAAIVGGAILTSADKDATAFYGFVTATLATVVGFGTLLRSNGKISEDVNRIETKVNGNLTKLIDIATDKAQTRKELKTINQIGVESGVIPVQESNNV